VHLIIRTRHPGGVCVSSWHQRSVISHQETRSMSDTYRFALFAVMQDDDFGWPGDARPLSRPESSDWGEGRRATGLIFP